MNNEAEEILEGLWVMIKEKKKKPLLSELKEEPGFHLLVDEGYIDTARENLLTENGLKEAELCVRRHRLAERLLQDVLHIKEQELDETSCKLEHILKKGLENNICILLGHPTFCPHGKPIPPGECCKSSETRTTSYVMPLSQLKRNQSGKLAFIKSDNTEILRKIMAMGAVPGSTIQLIQRFPSFVFQIGSSEFAVDREIADKLQIWVF